MMTKRDMLSVCNYGNSSIFVGRHWDSGKRASLRKHYEVDDSLQIS